MRDLWALFGDDLKAAQQSILEAHKKQPNNLHLLHLAISCGLHGTIQSIVDTDHLSISDRATLNYRLQLLRGNEDSAFRSIIGDQLASDTSIAIEQSLKNSMPLKIKMLGGIGDHLEALSIMQSWCTKHGININLHIQPNRIRQIKRLTNKLPWISELTTYGSEEVFTLFNSLRRFIYEHNEIHTPRALFDQKIIPTSDAMCCWRATGGPGEQFSTYSRSIPFHNVYNFYHAIIKKKPGITITDITQWKPWEKNKLLQLGIHLHDPAIGDIADLATLAASHQQIITIDTALAHLCAISNTKANLLLTLFPDERWNYLLKKDSCYAKNLCIFKQAAFGDWSSTMNQLIESINQNLAKEKEGLAP